MLLEQELEGGVAEPSPESQSLIWYLHLFVFAQPFSPLLCILTLTSKNTFKYV